VTVKCHTQKSRKHWGALLWRWPHAQGRLQRSGWWLCWGWLQRLSRSCAHT